MSDTRNVLDEFKNQPHEQIVAALDARGVSLQIAIENTLRDYNMGTIVRSANAFGVRVVHVIGRRQWNKRGAMMTDTYLQVRYHDSVQAFQSAMQAETRTVYALENNIAGTQLLSQTTFERQAVLLFGQEGAGISSELLAVADHRVAIEQIGSTRSLNVGVAAGIAMYAWQQNALAVDNIDN